MQLDEAETHTHREKDRETESPKISKIYLIGLFLPFFSFVVHFQKKIFVAATTNKSKNNIHMNEQTAHQNANNTFKSFFPSHKIPKHITPNFFTTQFYTGHGHFQKYLYRFTHSHTELCTCSNTTQDPTHLLLNCTHYTNIKYDLHLHNVNTLEEFIQNKNTHNNFKHLCTHIYKHLKTLFWS